MISLGLSRTLEDQHDTIVSKVKAVISYDRDGELNLLCRSSDGDKTDDPAGDGPSCLELFGPGGAPYL